MGENAHSPFMAGKVASSGAPASTTRTARADCGVRWEGEKERPRRSVCVEWKDVSGGEGGRGVRTPDAAGKTGDEAESIAWTDPVHSEFLPLDNGHGAGEPGSVPSVWSRRAEIWGAVGGGGSGGSARP